MKKINILLLSILLFISTFALANEQDHSNHDNMESNQIEIWAPLYKAQDVINDINKQLNWARSIVS